ncbi:hypothetical protein N9E03_01250 [bacterium]|nr:hypothetical protein [bacterium]
MAININHQADKIKSESDLILDAGAANNIDVSAKIVKNASDPVDAQDLVTKVYLETAISNVDASGDADTDTVLEIIENIRIGAYVKSVDFVSDIVTGGAGLTATLTISAVGDPNRYTIDWGDGTQTTATTDSTPTHTYATNTGSPFDVDVTAFNNTGSGSGSSAQKIREDYITIFTGDPAVSFVVYDSPTGGNAITHWDDGDTVYFENTTTNTSGAVIQYTWDWADGSADDVINLDSVAGGVGGGRIAHTFALSTQQEVQRTVTLTLDSHSTATPSLLPLDDDASYKIYDTHTPDATSDITTGINEESNNGLTVTFTNGTEATIGSYSTYGTRYLWDFGDGTITTVNVGSNQSGDTARTITHKYTLLDNSVAMDYTGNLQVLSDHSSSPFESIDFVIHVEPDVRANISGSADTVSDRNGDNIYDVYDGVDYNGVNRALVTVNNTSENGDSHTYDWNDSSSDDVEAGLNSVQHDFTGVTPGNYQLDFTATGTPDITAQTDSANLTFQVNAVPNAPGGLSTKTITLTDSAQGIDPKLANNFTDNSATSPVSAGASLNTNTERRYTSGTIDTSIAQNVYNGLSGTATAIVNGSTDGSKAFTTSLNENGTFDSLVISDQRDANDSISSTTYPTGFYQTFDAKITKPFVEYSTGVNDQRIEHDATGNTNYVTVICDDLTSVPTINLASATLTENTSGSYRYISGIPYYNTGSPTLTLSGASLSDWIGQAYRDTNNVFEIANGTNSEGTNGATISTQYKGYTDLEAVSYLTAGIPESNTGIGASGYALADQTINITTSSVKAVETLKFKANNVNGSSNYAELTNTAIQVHTANPTGVIEDNIPVANSLGNGTITEDGLRIADFVNSTTDTPAITGSTDYTATPFNGAVSVSGTQEATVRWGTLEHNTTDYSTGFLPVGPDRSSDTGTQYFTFAFRRQVVANFDISITSNGIAGMWIAAPGTGVDDASGLNGWIECTSQYAGAGVPGSDTANGGNGADGCALTGADVVPTGSSINSSYTMTLGSENMSNATNNVVLVRVALASGKEITSISIGEAS